MSDQTVQLLKLLYEKKTCNEICSILNISNKQLYNNLTNLRNKGFFLKRKYFSNGDIVYLLASHQKEIDNIVKPQSTKIFFSSEENSLKALAISDLHFGNIGERVDLVDKAFDYCIKNNIHIIFCGGDFVEGTHSKGKRIIENDYLQIEHFIKKYPFDKNIITIGVGGDHDIGVRRNSNQDILEIIRNYRHDIVIGDYNNFKVGIQKDYILLFHPIKSGVIQDIDIYTPILLRGHSHKYSINSTGNRVLDVTLPSLSNKNAEIPSAIEMNLQLKENYINTAILKQICFEENPIILREDEFDLLSRRKEELDKLQEEYLARKREKKKNSQN